MFNHFRTGLVLFALYRVVNKVVFGCLLINLFFYISFHVITVDASQTYTRDCVSLGNSRQHVFCQNRNNRRVFEPSENR